MKIHPARLVIVCAFAAAVLSACGGGGGNPGACSGSDEVCGRPAGTGNSNTIPVTVAPSGPTVTSTTATTSATGG